MKVHIGLFMTFLFRASGTFLDINEVSKNILQWKNQNLLNFSEFGAGSNGVFDFADVKNKILQWKQHKINSLCPSNGVHLQNLLSIVCSTAQPTNVTLRDSCISCFSRVTSMPEGPQELNGLSVCALQYLINTSYGVCATSLAELSTSALNVQPLGCYMGYCNFVKCLRRINSINLLTECTREARTGINLMLDADNVRFYTNVTSCILAKSRCDTFNPITGEPQTPGYTIGGVRATNTLQFSAAGELRILSFSANTLVANSFCTTPSNLTQTSWLTNDC